MFDPVAEALSRLEATAAASTVLPPVSAPAASKRLTYDTLATTTTPSFGHLHHENGHPVAVQIPLVLQPTTFIGVSVLQNGSRSAPGVLGNFSPNLGHISEAAETQSRHERRSAYVETVTDVGVGSISDNRTKSSMSSPHMPDLILIPFPSRPRRTQSATTATSIPRSRTSQQG